MPRGRALKDCVYLIRPIDNSLIDAIRIRTPASGFGGALTQLRFHIADNGIVLKHALIDRAEPGVVNVEPVEVTVETELSASRFGSKHLLNRFERLEVPIHPANHIQGLGKPLRRFANSSWAVAITYRADPAWLIQELL